jgi:hypothetical protein
VDRAGGAAPVVHRVHRGEPRIAVRPPRVRRRDARWVPVDPFGRAAAQVATHGSVSAIAAGWLDRGELVEVEIDDGLQRLTRWRRRERLRTGRRARRRTRPG